MLRKQLLLFSLLLSSAMLVINFNPMANAATIARNNPEQLLQQATDELLAISKAARDTAEQDRNSYYTEASAILNQVIDKDFFARGVMATYASTSVYKSLKTDAEREAFKARLKKFADALQIVLIEKYADALLSFKGERIDIAVITASNSEKNKASLLQTIYDTGNTTYKIQYNLSQQKDGNWLINNVIVEGVNLGSTYRHQFAEAVEKNRGDVDYVVNHWEILMSQTTTKPEAGND